MYPTTIEQPTPFHEIRLDPAETLPVSAPRSARFPQFIGFSAEAAGEANAVLALAAARIGVLGAGAVGREAAIHLARLGVGELWLCDRGHYKAESVLTQPIDPRELGRPKAEAVGRLCKRISPASRIFSFVGSFEELGPTAFAGLDAMVMATDNIRAEVECGQHCLHLGLPLIHAAVHGASLTAQVRCYAHASSSGPCPACVLGAHERAALDQEMRFSCEGGAARGSTAPTLSPSHLCAMAGSLAVNQLLRWTLGLGQGVLDRELEWNGFTHATRITDLLRRSSCPADHVVWSVLPQKRPIAQSTLRQIAMDVRMHDDGRLERAAFRVGSSAWVERAVCPSGHGQQVERFVEERRSAGDCVQCGRPLRAEPYFQHRLAPARLLSTRLDRPLGELCLGAPEWVLVRGDEDGVLVRPAMV